MTVSHDQSHPLDRARQLVTSEPLLAIDAALALFGATRGSRTGPETKECLAVLSSAVLTASRIEVDTGNNDPLSTMLNDGRCDELACASLLRLLTLDDHPFEEPDLRPAIALFDRVLSGRLYRGLDLAVRSQSFEKRERLRNHISRHEAEFLSLIDSLQTLEALPAFRQQLSKLFKDQATSVAIRPFLPHDVTVHSLTEMFTVAQAVAEADDEHLQERADAAIEVCSALANKASALPTSYSKAIVQSLADILRGLVLGRVKARGLADPATVRVEVCPRTYPLGHIGSPIAIRLLLENLGPGQAREVEVELKDQALVRLDDPLRQIGLVQPQLETLVFRGEVVEEGTEDAVLVRVSWKNADGSASEEEQIVDLPGQPEPVSWEMLELTDPYPLDAVKRADRFAGRDAPLRALLKRTLGDSPGTARIQGQRRVGKTSLANALAARVEEVSPGTHVFIRVEAGDFNANTAEQTLEQLGTRLFKKLRAIDPRFGAIEEPDFSGGIAPLTDVAEDMASLVPDMRVVIVIDEFEALPHASIYGRNPTATAFFQTLRSLGSKPNVGVILIGGERMRFVIANHGEPLNKYVLIPLDYFEPEHFDDYRQLVVGPVEDWLRYSEGAIEALYEATAGNPWITKLVASEIATQAIVARDTDVQQADAVEAITAAIPKLGTSTFQHFWEDAIQGDAEQQMRVSLARRGVLLALGTCVRARAPVTEEALVREARRYGVDQLTASDVIKGFKERSIFVEAPGGTIRTRVPIFAAWLAEEGPRQIVVSMGDDDAIRKREEEEERARPKTPELQALVDRWRTYRGRTFDAERLREWLLQFGPAAEQRLMLKLLQRVRYYNDTDVRDRVRGLHSFVLRDLAEAGYEYRFSGASRFRSDIVITSLEGGGSGASALVKPYRDENKIYKTRAIDATALPDLLVDSGSTIRAVVILEDFVGTGGTARTEVSKLYRAWNEAGAIRDDVSFYLVAVCGFDDAVDTVRRQAERLKWNLTIHVADPLDARDKCFAAAPPQFADDDELERARALAVDRGSLLDPKFPLGFGHTEAAVSFEFRCPNNSLPIFWKESDSWQPLFPRL